MKKLIEKFLQQFFNWLFRKKTLTYILFIIVAFFLRELAALSLGEELIKVLDKARERYPNDIIVGLADIIEFLFGGGSIMVLLLTLIPMALIGYLKNKELTHGTNAKKLQYLIENKFNPQPALTKYSSNKAKSKGLYKYHFSKNRESFYGRDTELESLNAFCINQEAKFSWWALTGEGASGKSRLALKFCERLDNYWYWGWYNLGVNPFKFDEWEPIRNTLIIIDYVVGNDENLKAVFEGFNQLNESDKLNYKVRVLLIERSKEGWYNRFRKLPIIGVFLNETLYNENLLSTQPLDKNTLVEITKDSLKRLNKNENEAQEIVDKAVLMSANRAPLLVQLLSEISDKESLEELISEFLSKEKINRWIPAGINDKDEEVLALATMSGGIDLEDTSFSNEESKLYFTSYTSFDSYALMTGKQKNTKHLQSLEPDLFGELLALNKLEPLNQLQLENTNSLLNLVYGVHNGKPLLSFFTRCSQDFPKHPTLRILQNPIGRNYGEHVIWALSISNIIDVINLSPDEQLETYKKVLDILKQNYLDAIPIEKILFLRLLNHISVNDSLRQYFGYFEIISAQLPALQLNEQQQQNLLDSLIPEEYCNLVMSEFGVLTQVQKNVLLGPHIIEVYNHTILRKLADRAVNFNEIETAFDFIWELVNTKHEEGNYLPSIINFHYLCSNIAIGISQFNRLPNNDDRLQYANLVLERALIISRIVSNGRPGFVSTPHLSRIFLPISVFTVSSQQKIYEDMQEVMEKFKSATPKIDDRTNSEIFVGLCVQFARGFTSQEQHNYFIELYEECFELYEKFKTKNIVENFGYMINQMLSNRHIQGYENYISEAQDELFLSTYNELALNHPLHEDKVLSNVLRTYSNRYRRAIDLANYVEANKYMILTKSLVEATKNVVYEFGEMNWPGETGVRGFDEYIENSYPIEPTIEILMLMNESKNIYLDQAISSIPGKIFGLGEQAKNQGDLPKYDRCKECLVRLLELNLFEDRMNGSIKQMIDWN